MNSPWYNGNGWLGIKHQVSYYGWKRFTAGGAECVWPRPGDGGHEEEVSDRGVQQVLSLGAGCEEFQRGCPGLRDTGEKQLSVLLFQVWESVLGGEPHLSTFSEREREREREREKSNFFKMQTDDCFEHPVHRIGLTPMRMSMMVVESVLVWQWFGVNGLAWRWFRMG